MPSKNETKQVENLRENLEKIKALEGVIGYILRGSTSASVDLKDSTKIIEYAALSSTALEAGEEISKTFDLGEIDTIILEGKDAKILSLTIGDHRLSIFMDKNIDHNAICKELDLE